MAGGQAGSCNFPPAPPAIQQQGWRPLWNSKQMPLSDSASSLGRQVPETVSARCRLATIRSSLHLRGTVGMGDGRWAWGPNPRPPPGTPVPLLRSFFHRCFLSTFFSPRLLLYPPSVDLPSLSLLLVCVVPLRALYGPVALLGILAFTSSPTTLLSLLFFSCIFNLLRLLSLGQALAVNLISISALLTVVSASRPAFFPDTTHYQSVHSAVSALVCDHSFKSLSSWYVALTNIFSSVDVFMDLMDR